MKQIFYTVAGFLFSFTAIAQPIAAADSLRKLLQQARPDTQQVLWLLQYGEQFETSQPDTALYYYELARQLATQLQYKKGLSTYTSYVIVVLNNQGRFKEALERCKENISRWEGSGNLQELAAAYINVGSEWQYLSDLPQAAESYIKALGYAEKLQHLPYQRVANNNLASVFNSLQQYDKGLAYAKKALSIARQLNNDYGIASSTINMAVSAKNLLQYDSAIAHSKQVEQLGYKIADNMIVMDGWLGLGDTYSTLKKWAVAEDYYRKTIALAIKDNTPEYQLYGCMGLSDLLIKNKQYAAASPVVNTGINLGRQLGTRLELKDLYLRAAELNEATGNSIAALQWHKQFVALNDSLLNEKNSSNINLMEIKFDTEKKQGQINQLETEKRLQELRLNQQRFFKWFAAGSAVSILIIALLGYRNQKQKQLLQQQRITELEKEKQLMATEAMLRGQEEERSRLAKDLHDGLGGMLSSVKYAFSNIKENLVMTADNMQNFERSIDLLDISIKEMRRVAHSMMPEALLKFGLDAALKDFCTGINASGVIKVIYQSHDLASMQVSPTVSVTIYRVIQELVNNIIKHAAATTAIVQLNVENKLLHITVEDDGKGFDPAQLPTSGGIGWSNISSRLDYLKASTDIQSEPGKGTSVLVTIDVSKG
jgi:signal transduction histidine kinase